MRKYRRGIITVAILSVLLGIISPVMVCSSEENKITDGSYSISVALWNASADQTSMGNNALQQTGKLVVKDGKAELYLKFMQMTFSGMTGYLSSIDLLEDITFNEFHYPEKYKLIPGTVHSYYNEVDAFNGPDSTDIHCAGKKYPKVVSVLVSLEEKNIWAHVYVPVMGSLGFGDQICRIHINTESIKKLTEEEAEQWEEDEKSDAGSSDTVSAADKTELGTLVNQAKELIKQTEKYTETSLLHLQGVLSNAEKAYQSDVTQTVVNGQVALLREAISALVEKSTEQLDKDNLKDGKYYVYIYLWHATSNQASMGDPALNHEALLTVSNGVYSVDLSTHSMTVGTITACLQSLQIKQPDGSWLSAEITARENTGNQPSIFHFTLPSREEYVDVLIDPKVEVMGKDPLPARLKINWDTLKSAAQDAVVNTSQTDSADTAVTPAVNKTDSKTKIRLKAGKNVMPADAEYIFRRIRSGSVYKKAVWLWKSAADFRIYEITALSEGEKVKPAGMVKLSIPVPDSYIASKVTVSRLDGGNKTLMSGKYKNGYYVFSTNQLGNFVISTTEKKNQDTDSSDRSRGKAGSNWSASDSTEWEMADPVPDSEDSGDASNISVKGQSMQPVTEETMENTEESVENTESGSNTEDSSQLLQQQFSMAIVVMSVFASGILSAVTMAVCLYIGRNKIEIS